MSEKPRRWDIECTGIGDDVDMVERPKGNYVLMEDYARLKAEVERLRKFNEEALAHIAKEERKSWERLDMAQDEVERLRKAGDAMEVSLQSNFNGCPYEPIVIIEVIRRWRNAKEGKQP